MTDWSDAEDREQAALDAARLHEWATERRIDARDAEIARLRAEIARLRGEVDGLRALVDALDPPGAPGTALGRAYRPDVTSGTVPTLNGAVAACRVCRGETGTPCHPDPTEGDQA